jgi:WD40 repeat protein
MSLFTPTRVLRTLPSALHSVWFVQPGQLLVSCQYWSREQEDAFGAIRLITEDGRCLGQTQGRHSTGYTAVHPSGQEFACSGHYRCTLHDLRAGTLRLLRRLRIDRQKAERVLYTPDGRWLIWGGPSHNPETDHPLLRWDTTDWASSPLPGFTQSVSRLAISADGRSLLVGGSDGGIQVRELKTWEVLANWQGPPEGELNRPPGVLALQLSADGCTLYAALNQPPFLRSFRFPDFRPGKPFEQAHPVHALVLLSDGTLVSGDAHGDVTFWDGESATVQDRYNARGRRQIVTDVARGRSEEEETGAGSVSSLAVSPDGRRLAVGDGIGESSGRVHLLDLTL